MVDEPASEKYSLLEDASKWGAESAKSVTDDDESASVSARTLSKDAMKAPPDENIAASQSPHVTTVRSYFVSHGVVFVCLSFF